MEDHEFLAAFEAGTLPEELFHHRNHVRAGWLVLREVSPAFALARFSSALRRFASLLGKADRYHETITWAYLLLINERMERTGRRGSWQEFADTNPDLLTWRGTVLRSYYRDETLQSELARRVFLLPDRLLK